MKKKRFFCFGVVCSLLFGLGIVTNNNNENNVVTNSNLTSVNNYSDDLPATTSGIKQVCYNAKMSTLGYVTKNGSFFIAGNNVASNTGIKYTSSTKNITEFNYVNDPEGTDDSLNSLIVDSAAISFFSTTFQTNNGDLYYAGFTQTPDGTSLSQISASAIKKFQKLIIYDETDEATPIVVKKYFYLSCSDIDSTLGVSSSALYERLYVISNTGKLYNTGVIKSTDSGVSSTSIKLFLPKLNDIFCSETEKVTDIQTGTRGSGDFSIGILTDSGNLYLSGNQSNGVLGDGVSTSTKRLDFIKASDADGNVLNVKSFSMSSSSTGIVTNGGDCYFTGSNEYGQQGISTDTSVITKFTKRNQEGEKVKKTFTCSLDTSSFNGYLTYELDPITGNDLGGDLYFSGSNDYGVIGDGTTTAKSSFTKVTNKINTSEEDDGTLPKIISCVCNGYNFALITVDGDGYAWGKNDHKQVCNRSTSIILKPCGPVCSNVVVDPIVPSFYSWDYAILFLKQNGDLIFSGYDKSGAAGTGSSGVTITAGSDDSLIAYFGGKVTVSISNWDYGDTPSTPSIHNVEGDYTTYKKEYCTYTGGVEGTYSETVPTLPGNYRLRVTSSATTDYRENVSYDTFSINKIEGTGSVSQDNIVYGSGDIVDPVITNTSNYPTELVEYAVYDDDYILSSYESTVPTAVGNYNVRVSFSGLTGYNDLQVDDNFSITAGTGSGTVSISSWVFGATPSTPTYDTECDYTDCDFIYSDDDFATETTTQPTEVGSYKMKGYLYGSYNYSDFYTEPVSFTIEEENHEGTGTVTQNDITYGTEVNPTIDNPLDYPTVTLTYRKEFTDEWVSEKPTEVGTYVVKAVFSGSSYYDSFVDVDEFKINKASEGGGTGTITSTVKLDSWTYGDTPNEPSVITSIGYADVVYEYSLDGGETWVTTQPSEPGEYLVRAKLSNSEHYVDTVTAPVTFYIYKHAGSGSVKQDDIIYGTEVNPVVTCSVSYSVTTLKYSADKGSTWIEDKPTEPGVYKVEAIFTSCTYYEDFIAYDDFTISKASGDGEVNIDNWTEGDTPSNPTSKTSFDYSKVTYQYSIDNGKTWTINKPTSSGNYLIRGIFSGSSEYADYTSKVVEFSILRNVYDLSWLLIVLATISGLGIGAGCVYGYYKYLEKRRLGK